MYVYEAAKYERLIMKFGMSLDKFEGLILILHNAKSPKQF